MRDRSEHWLWRLSAEAWLAAARGEIQLGQRALGSRRTAVTHARRGAGMALNGVLVTLETALTWPTSRCESALGRSYIDHLRILANAPEGDAASLDPFDLPLRQACRELLGLPVMPAQGLVSLARSRDEVATRALALGAEIVEICAVNHCGM